MRFHPLQLPPQARWRELWTVAISAPRWPFGFFRNANDKNSWTLLPGVNRRHLTWWPLRADFPFKFEWECYVLNTTATPVCNWVNVRESLQDHQNFNLGLLEIGADVFRFPLKWFSIWLVNFDQPYTQFPTTLNNWLNQEVTVNY